MKTSISDAESLLLDLQLSRDILGLICMHGERAAVNDNAGKD